MFKVSLLGNPTLFVNNERISHAATKSVFALLAYLTEETHSRIFHSREKLAEMLWPGMPPGSGRKNLRQSLYELNKLLPETEDIPVILGNRQSIQWNTDIPVEIDTYTFEQLLQIPGVENLRQAVELYQGDFLGDFYLPDSAEFENWAQNRREHYRRRFREALRSLIPLDPSHAEDYARHLIEIDPLDEEAARTLMGILAKNDARIEALQLFEALRRNLQEQLGVKPDPQTIALYEQISSGKIEGTRPPQEIPPPPPPRAPLRLPGTSTPFIGRRPEVEQVKVLIQHPDHRLITLLGPGGTGKTRLSIQAASELDGVFLDGIFFASLAPVQSADGVLAALAKALDCTFYPGQESQRQQLLNFLREKRLLLVLDNFEHLLDAAELVAEILTTANAVKLVVTSRVRLNVPGEQLYPVGGMHIPEAGEAEQWDDPETQARPFSAVQLFLERARRVQPGFVLTRENAPFVLEICRLVQGMPLALELAASWMELLQPAEIATEIACSLDFLETDQAGIPDRQRSIRAVFDSSWKLLSETERDAFLRLCVFAGSFSREAAQEVSGASLRTLLGLVNKSWLQQTEGGRVQLHELMWQYGDERLRADEGAWRAAKDRHADYFAHFAAEQSAQMRGPEQIAAFMAFGEERDGNVKAAWDWLLAEKRWGDLVERLAPAILHLAMATLQQGDMIPWFRKARLALQPTESEEQLYFAILSTLEVYCEESVSIKDADPIERLGFIWQLVIQNDLAGAMGFWFVFLAGLVRARNMDPSTGERLEAVIAQLRRQNVPWELGFSLLVQSNWWVEFGIEEDKLLEAANIFKGLGVIFEQGLAAELLGRYAESQNRPLEEIMQYYEEVKKLHMQLGHQFPSRIRLYWSAGINFQRGRPEKGFAILQEERREFERLGNIQMVMYANQWESLQAVRYSTFEHARTTRERSLELARKLGVQTAITWDVYELGDIYRVFGELDKAHQLYEQAHEGFEQMGILLGLAFYERAQGDMALRDGYYSEALAHYQKFADYAAQDNHLWSIGQSSAKLALVHAYLKNHEAARALLREELIKHQKWGENQILMQVLLTEPVCLLGEGNHEKAIELAAFLIHNPVSWNEVKSQASEIQEIASTDLAEEIIQAAIEQGKGLGWEGVVKQLLGE